MLMVRDDTKKLLKFVSAREPENKEPQAQVTFEAYMVEGKAKWTYEDKEDFLRRVETACREVCGWFAEKIEVKE